MITRCGGWIHSRQLGVIDFLREESSISTT